LSTLTKVFVILLVVFSIAFTAMTVSIVAQTTNWRTMAEKYEEHAKVADTNLRNLIAANAAELATARDAHRSLLDQIADLERNLQSGRNETSKLTSDLAKVAAEKSSGDAMNRALLAQLQSAEAARNEYKKQRDELEQQSIDLQRRNIDLNDRVNEQTAQIAVLMEQKRQYEQQLNILRSENEKLANESRRATSGLALEDPATLGLTGVSALVPISPSAIKGHIIEVSGDLVTLSVGTADGVQKNMVFVVYRDDQYVCDVRITLADPDRSAGRIVQSAVAPKVGDQATDAIRFSASRR